MPCRELHAKFLPADEGCPQGPRTRHTRTMRAFSSASAAQLTCPPRHTRYKTRPTHPHQHRTRYKTHPTHPHQHHHRYKTRPAHPTNTAPSTKLALHTVKRPIWALFRVQGEFIHACGSNKPSMRISLAHAASFEARHTAVDLHAPNVAAPLISRRSPTYGRRPSRPQSDDC